MAKAWGTLPSRILHIDDPYIAFCVDEAVYAFGAAIEGELNEMKKAKGEKDETFARRKEAAFRRFIGVQKPDKQRFATPVATR